MSGGTFESARSNLFSNLVDGLFHLFSSWSLFPALLRSQVTPLAKVKFLLAKTVPFLQLGENSKNWEEGSCGGCYSHSIDGLLI